MLYNNVTVDTGYVFVKTQGAMQHGIKHNINKIWLNISC